MAIRRFGIGGFELAVVVNDSAMTVSGSVRNRFWRNFLYRLLRRGAYGDRDTTHVRHHDIAVPADASEETRALIEKVAGHAWYHSIELTSSLCTPGLFDHRPYLQNYRLPERMDGMRVLDVATFDGFWAFEMERRGAAEVIALDIDTRGDADLRPRDRIAMSPEMLNQKFGGGFAIAREALGSRVERVPLNVYELSPERLGKFDFVLTGDLLVHLMDPVRALSCIRSVTRGCAQISESVSPEYDDLFADFCAEYRGGKDLTWWKFGPRTLGRMIEDAGFDKIEPVSEFKFGPAGMRPNMTHAVYRAYPPDFETAE